MRVVHENKFAQAYYDEANQIIWHRYIDVVNADLLITCHRADLTFVKTNPVQACFYDLTKMKGTFTKVLNFIITEYEPTLFKNGVKYGSFAMSDQDVFMKFAMNQMFKLMPTRMELKVLKEIPEAIHWLSERMNKKIPVYELPKPFETSTVASR